jgi:hypothetical protein
MRQGNADVLLVQLEKICQETSSTKVYAAAKLLGIPHALKDFQRIIADFQSRLMAQGYFHLDEKPQIAPEQIEEIRQRHELLRPYELVKDEEEFRLVKPQTDQTAYYVHCYPRFTEKSQFWGWGIQFRHAKNPRLDVSLDCDESASYQPSTTDNE